MKPVADIPFLYQLRSGSWAHPTPDTRSFVFVSNHGETDSAQSPLGRCASSSNIQLTYSSCDLRYKSYPSVELMRSLVCKPLVSLHAVFLNNEIVYRYGILTPITNSRMRNSSRLSQLLSQISLLNVTRYLFFYETG